MDGLSFFWLLGEASSIVALIFGAGLSVFASEPFHNWYSVRPNAHVPRPEVHEPLNHRLLLEPEW